VIVDGCFWVTHLLFPNIFQTFQHNFNTISTDPETAAKMPAVLALRDALYTPSFRQFVAEITGVNDLTDRVDCSINAYGTCFRGCAVERGVFGIIVF
jgi:hypothetical protein